MWKKIKLYFVLTIIGGLSIAVAYLYYFPRRGGVIRRIVDAPAIVQQIQQLNELVAVKYSIQKIIGLKEEKVPFGSESVLLMVQATVLGGVDLSVLKTEDIVIADDRGVTIKLPPPKVLHVFVNEKDTQVWDRSKTWWTPWVPFNPELEQKARLAALEDVQLTSINMGILRDAQKNAETNIREFLRNTGFGTVRFETVPASP